MNLQEFLDYRKDCPVCKSNSLNTVIYGQKHLKIKEEECRFIIVIIMRPLKKGATHYDVGFSIDKTDNSFFIEFYNNAGSRLDTSIPVSLLKQFKVFRNNIKWHYYRIARLCNICRQYKYQSCNIMDDEKFSLKNILIECEFFGLYKPKQDRYDVYRLYNYVDSKYTTIYFGNFNYKLASYIDEFPQYSKYFGSIELPLVRFSTVEEMLDKIETIITFS